ncbi:MAG: agmatine deiminase family protein [Planctomycetota bacterium]
MAPLDPRGRAPSEGGSEGSLAAARLRLPAEWEPHARTWLAWPHRASDWPGIFERIPPVWVAMARALREGEPVAILVSGPAMAEEVRRAFSGDLAGIELVEIPTDRAWIRDYGPIAVESSGRPGARVATKWRFNSWGGKYPPWDLDDAAGAAIAERIGIPCVRTGLVLEGGSIDADGEGTILTTESCLLNPNRNPELSREEIEAVLAKYLGAEKVLWLGRGIEGDDTDGHVDDLARFVAPGVVAAAAEDDPRDPNGAALEENLERLRGLRDAKGRRLEVVELPMPPPVFHEGHRCPASYANFYVANSAVLFPGFGCPEDGVVRGILEGLFPGRRVVAVEARDLVWGLGAVHCVTRDEPAARR